MAVVLVVDDDPLQLDILSAILSDKGHETHVASSGEEALKVAGTLVPDVVLTDLHMGRMSGLDLMKKLGSRVNAPEVIIMSACGALFQAAGINGKNACRFLEKPLDKCTVLLYVQQAAERAALSRKNECRTLLSERDI